MPVKFGKKGSLAFRKQQEKREEDQEMKTSIKTLEGAYKQKYGKGFAMLQKMDF